MLWNKASRDFYRTLSLLSSIFLAVCMFWEDKNTLHTVKNTNTSIGYLGIAFMSIHNFLNILVTWIVFLVISLSSPNAVTLRNTSKEAQLWPSSVTDWTQQNSKQKVNNSVYNKINVVWQVLKMVERNGEKFRPTAYNTLESFYFC